MSPVQNSNIHDIILSAKKQGASDVHFVVGTPPIIRVNSEFVPLANEAVVTAMLTEALMKELLAPEDEPIFRQTKNLIRTYTFPDGLRCRYRIFYQKGVPSLAFHILSETVPTLASLHLSEEVTHFTTLTHGLVVVSGPYGSGRSSTATALLQEINHTRGARIITVESPIEYLLSSDKSVVEQREVGRDVATYHEALAELIDGDVEVILIGALDDPASVPILLQLAMTRLVFIIFEATTSMKALERLITFSASPDLPAIRSALADALAGVIVQRSVLDLNGQYSIVAEVLLATGPVQTIIRDGKLAQLNTFVQTSRSEGMVSLDQALAEAVSSGRISAEEAIRHAADPEYLKGLLQRRAK